jgi:RNA polymerase sigma-70 factor (sigma-E family)
MTDDADFSEFVHANTPTLLKTAYLLTGNPGTAEDLVQDTFVRLYPKWFRVTGCELPLAYVRRSLVNNYVNSQRSRSGHEVLLADLPEQTGPGDVAAEATDRVLIGELLNSLPPRQRAVLVLRFFHDLSDKQIAADLGCRSGTVRSIVSRSLSALRRADSERRGREHTTMQANGSPS